MKFFKIIIVSIIFIIIILVITINMLRNSKEKIPETNTIQQKQSEEVEKQEETRTIETLINEQREQNALMQNTVPENTTLPVTNETPDSNYLSEENTDESYEQATVEGKVEINIKKFIEAINKKDYNTAYSYLEASFKQKNISTVQQFENIVKNYFWEQNTLIMGELEDLGNNIYRTEITLNNPNGSNSDEKNMTVIMQLKEDQNFIMRFTLPEPTEITNAP